MKASTSSRSPRSRAALEVVVLLSMAMAVLPASGSELEPPAAQDAPRAREPLYLSVVVNRTARPGVYEVFRQDDLLFATPETLQEWGLRRPSGGGEVALQHLPGVTVQYFVRTQQLELTVPPSMLDAVPLRLTSGIAAGQPPDATRRVPGLLVNYDLFAQQGQTFGSFNAVTEFRLLSIGGGVLSQGAALHAARVSRKSDSGILRLDTTWRRSFHENRYTISAGDTITRGLPWTRSLRIAGLQLARDFALQPYRPTTPLMSVDGEAALPSTVELFINGQRQTSHQVPPGIFRIDALPSVTGNGRAQVVVTDLAGRAQRIDLDFYAAPSLLQTGLIDGSIEIGYPRHNYGLDSGDYDRRPVALGTLRYGLSDAFTLEAHGESSSGLRMAGMGGVARLPRQLGLLSGSFAQSEANNGAGTQHSWAYQYLGPRFSAAWTLLRRSRGYRDAAAVIDGPMPRLLSSLSAGTPTPLGHLSFGWARQRGFDGASSSLFSASLSCDLPYHSVLTLSVLAGSGREARPPQLTANWLVPLEPGSTLSTTFTAGSGRGAGSLQYSHEPSQDRGGIGYRIEGSASRWGAASHAQIHGSSVVAEWAAGVSRSAGGESLFYSSIDGSLLLSPAGLHPMARVGDGFALVSTSGIGGIPVRLENRLVGTTDAAGMLLVPTLNAYQLNHLSIDTLDLPADFRAEAVSSVAVPERGSGVAVDFQIRKVHPLQLTVLDASGHPIPPGSEVVIANAHGEQVITVSGHEGFVYTDSPPTQPTRISARGEFGTCTAVLVGIEPPGTGVSAPVRCLAGGQRE